jgi:hypothetical protein
MKHHYSLLLAVVLTLLLAACSRDRNGQVANVQAVQPSAVATISAPTAAVEASEASGAAIATSPALNDAFNSCAVTRPPEQSFTPPAPYSQNAPGNYFWYGTDSLWTAVPGNGMWSALPHNPDGYTQKVLWWRKGYSWTAEPEPQLFVTGRRLDAPASPAHVSRATNAYAADIGSAMMVGIDFPTPGCWEITGRYAGAELSFIVWVAP